MGVASPERPAGRSGGQLLSITDLRLGIQRTRRERLMIVDSATFAVRSGELLGLVGESGSGKTMVCRSLIGTLNRRGVSIFGGSIDFKGTDLTTLDERQWQEVRGRSIGYVPQSALAGPNPVMTIEGQLAEAIGRRSRLSRRKTRSRALELLDLVHIRRPEVVLKQYPNQLSGGMRQRVMIACVLAQMPDLIVADEPTTGLDVTVQAEIMKLLKEIRAEYGTAILLVSHDLALIDEICDRIVVMHAGTCVEDGATSSVARQPLHPYTIALNSSRIDIASPGQPLRTIKGQPPAVGEWPAGCRFAARCDMVRDDCRVGAAPDLRELAPDHLTACIHAEDLLVGSATPVSS